MAAYEPSPIINGHSIGKSVGDPYGAGRAPFPEVSIPPSFKFADQPSRPRYTDMAGPPGSAMGAPPGSNLSPLAIKLTRDGGFSTPPRSHVNLSPLASKPYNPVHIRAETPPHKYQSTPSPHMASSYGFPPLPMVLTRSSSSISQQATYQQYTVSDALAGVAPTSPTPTPPPQQMQLSIRPRGPMTFPLAAPPHPQMSAQTVQYYSGNQVQGMTQTSYLPQAYNNTPRPPGNYPADFPRVDMHPLDRDRNTPAVPTKLPRHAFAVRPGVQPPMSVPNSKPSPTSNFNTFFNTNRYDTPNAPHPSEYSSGTFTANSHLPPLPPTAPTYLLNPEARPFSPGSKTYTLEAERSTGWDLCWDFNTVGGCSRGDRCHWRHAENQPGDDSPPERKPYVTVLRPGRSGLELVASVEAIRPGMNPSGADSGLQAPPPNVETGAAMLLS